ncbi:MAG: hypothetical protein WCQ20_13445 [Synechococcaceae cyanobacterium ELA739]
MSAGKASVAVAALADVRLAVAPVLAEVEAAAERRAAMAIAVKLAGRYRLLQAPQGPDPAI